MNKPSLIWYGDVSFNHSLSILGREVVYGLNEYFDIYIQEISQFHPPIIDDKTPLLEKLKQKVIEKPAQLQVRCHYPPDLTPPPPETKLICWIPWELNQLPKQWKEFFNKYAVSVAGICQYNEQVFTEQLETHAYHIPPIIHDVFYQDYEKNEQEETTFMYDGGTTWRKGFDIILDNFVRYFAGNTNVKLIYKDSKVYRSNIFDMIKDSNINCEYHLRNMTWEELRDEYAKADYYLYPSRGEGFGFGAAQAMTMGIPVIGSGHTGLDFITDDNAYVVPFDVVNFGDEGYLKSDQWISDELGYEWDEPLQYPEPNQELFMKQILNAMTAKKPLHDKKYYRRYMSKHRKEAVIEKWLEYLNSLL